VGKAAKDMLGRTPGNIVAIKPMKDGVIADFEIIEKMLTYFIKKAHNRNVWVHPRIVIGVPSETTHVEKRAVKDSAYHAKASEVHLVEEAMAAAIGAGMPITCARHASPAGSPHTYRSWALRASARMPWCAPNHRYEMVAAGSSSHAPQILAPTVEDLP